MLEANALQSIVELDVDPQVIGVELQPIARHQAAFFIDVHRQRGNRTVESQVPMHIAIRVPIEQDRRAILVALD